MKTRSTLSVFSLCLILSVSISSARAQAADTDGDGISDSKDNCSLVANTRADSCDTDGDGIGNLCDGDFNQDGSTDGADFVSAFLPAFERGTDHGLGTDMDCDGTVSGLDFFKFLENFLTGSPGPGITNSDAPWNWVALDNSAEGSAAEVIVDQRQSDESETFAQVFVHGFWKRSRQGPTGETFTELRVPGMGSTEELGAPKIPVVEFSIAIPAGDKIAQSNRGDWLQAQVDVGEEARIMVERVWPVVVESTDQAAATPAGEESVSTPEKFVIDRKIYDQDVSWPGEKVLRDLETSVRLRSIGSARISLSPMRWNPKTGVLDVAKRMTVRVLHPVKAATSEPMTLDREKIAKAEFLNWEAVSKYFPADFRFYAADFLIIYPNKDYADEIKPFADQKRARGYRVREMRANDIGTTCADFRLAIQNWESTVPAWRDAYALLVGDTDVIPLCVSSGGLPTDDLYASTNGDDLDEEVFLGRLSVNDEADLASQIAKILAYEDNPSPFCCYHQAALWAHKEDAPEKYEGAHETVRTNAYALPPTFITYYGSQVGVADADIRNEVDGGVGVLAYRGHGSAAATGTSWNQGGESFNDSDVGLLSNTSPQTPVVWSFACSNSALDEGGSCAGGSCSTTPADDSIAEIWMEKEDSGSVSYYGATVPSRTNQNHVLDEWMFLAVYDEGLVKQSHAIRRAEAQMAALSGSRNAWMYLLLGDPDMDIRRRNPISIEIWRPELYRICDFGDCRLELTVIDAAGNPIPGARVGIWKEDPSGRSEGEVFTNGYTDVNGRVELEAAAQTEGEIHFSVRLEGGDGAITTGVIPVVAGETGVSVSSPSFEDPLTAEGTGEISIGGSSIAIAQPGI